jgi:hypothetical protein
MSRQPALGESALARRRFSRNSRYAERRPTIRRLGRGDFAGFAFAR